MFSFIRRRASFVNVVAVFVLVFAMAGGAYAAKKYVITSTSQIKPSVLKSLQGKAGPAGAAGPQGPQGPAGAAGASVKGEPGAAGKDGTNGAPGPKGETGPTGATGTKGLKGENGNEGPTGPKGVTGTAGATGVTGPAGTTGPEGVCAKAGCSLPSGATETGVWSDYSFNLPTGVEPKIAVSFPIQLQAASTGAEHAFFFTAQQTEELEEGELAETHGCAGTVVAPTAPKGELCIYTAEEETKSSANFLRIQALGFLQVGQYSKTGTLIVYKATSEPAQLQLKGSWAVTAP